MIHKGMFRFRETIRAWQAVHLIMLSQLWAQKMRLILTCLTQVHFNMGTLLQNMQTIIIATHKLQMVLLSSKEEQINIQVQLISLLLHFRIQSLTLVPQVTHITMLVVIRLLQDMELAIAIIRTAHGMVEALKIIMLSHIRTTRHPIPTQYSIPFQCLPILSHTNSSTTNGHTITITPCQILLVIQSGTVTQLLTLLLATPIPVSSHLLQELHHGKVIQVLLLRLLFRYVPSFLCISLLIVHSLLGHTLDIY